MVYSGIVLSTHMKKPAIADSRFYNKVYLLINCLLFHGICCRKRVKERLMHLAVGRCDVADGKTVRLP